MLKEKTDFNQVKMISYPTFAVQRALSKTFFKKNLQYHSISLPLPRVGNHRTVCHRPLSMVKPPPRTCQNVCHMGKHAQRVCKPSLSGDKHALHMCKHFLSPRQTFLSRV